MTLGKKIAASVERLSGGPERRSGYQAVLWERFRKNRLSRAAFYTLLLLLFIALFADFIANEKPLYCKLEGKTYFPVIRTYGEKLGLVQADAQLVNARWSELEYEAVVFAPIPYSPQTIDRRNARYVGPFEEQRVSSRRFRHWLGTDLLGRDVAAGMIGGTRVAMLVGIISMSIASLIGILLGSLAGFFGDSGARFSPLRLLLNLLGLTMGWFWGFQARQSVFLEAGESGGIAGAYMGGFGWMLLALLIANGLAWLLERIVIFRKKIRLPLDALVMRTIEVVNAIPAIFLILSLAALIRQSSIIYIMVIIGLIAWTGIARFVRAEFLRLREQEFVEAARVLGFSQWRIMMRHILPNALTPVIITIAFGTAAAILAEATLSFLGVGLAPEDVSWGVLLSDARKYIRAWWLAVFPGTAIFITVTMFNLLGEGLTAALDPRLQAAGKRR